MADYSIGVDLGGTNLRAASVDKHGKMLNKMSGSTDLAAGRDAVIGDMVEAIQKLKAEAGSLRLAGVGIGIPGFILMEEGIVVGSNNLPQFEGFPVRDEIERRLGTQVILENDANAAALGEKWIGAGKDVKDLVLLTLGTGIGGGIISGGVLQRGRHGFAGEVGHMTVDRDGERCVCGRRGCWELVASGSALSRMAGRAGEDVTAAARAGDPQALDVLDRFAGAVASGLSNLIVTLDPAVVVLGGGVLDPPKPLLGLIRTRLSRSLGDAGSHRPRPDIRAAELGRRAGAIGAALLARDHSSAAATSRVGTPVATAEQPS